MKTILAFGASNSKASINSKFARFAADQLRDFTLDFLDLNDFEMPIYSIDREKDTGIPDLAVKFKNKIREANGIIISFAEHNGAYTVAFKNIYDWISRIEANVWNNTPMLLLSTSPGSNGGQNVLKLAQSRFQRSNKAPMIGFSLPSFEENFRNNQIVNDELNKNFQQSINNFIDALHDHHAYLS